MALPAATAPTGSLATASFCTDVDGCDGDPCFPGATCIDNAPPEVGFTCGTCPTGFEGDGLSCTDIDECASSPCFGDIVCTDAVAPQTGFTCGDCPPGTTGDGEACDLLCNPVSNLNCGGQLSGNNGGAGSADVIDNWECSGFSFTGPGNHLQLHPRGFGHRHDSAHRPHGGPRPYGH